ILTEHIPVPKLYFAHQRQVIERNNVLLAVSHYLPLKHGEEITTRTVRYRTCGDMTITGATESSATTVEEIIIEIAASRQTERGTRADDKRSETAMEERKK